MAEELADVREQLYSTELKNGALEALIGQRQLQHNEQTHVLKRELAEQTQLNRHIKDNQQLAINRLIGKHTSQLSDLRDSLAREHSNQISFYEQFIRRMKDTQERSAQLMRQQLDSQQQKNDLLEDNGRRLQNMLEQYQERSFRQKEELLDRNSKLEGELMTLRKLYSEEAAHKNSLMEDKSKLQKKLERLEKRIEKMDTTAILEKKLTEKTFTKERSLSARLRKQLELHENHLRVVEVSDKIQKREQRLKEKQLLQSIGNIKRRYEQQHSELMSKLVESDRSRQKSSRRHSSNRDLMEIFNCPNLQEDTSKMFEDSREGRPLEEKQLEGSTRYHTFEMADPDPQPTQKTSKKSGYKHLRINSTADTTKPSECSQLQLDVSTPCFESGLEVSRTKPSRKISIKLRK